MKQIVQMQVSFLMNLASSMPSFMHALMRACLIKFHGVAIARA